MSAEVFVDTNVLVYVFDRRDATKQASATSWVDGIWTSGGGALSTQVLQEFYNVTTRKLGQPLPRGEAREVIRRLGQWRVVSVDPSVIQRAFLAEDTYGLSWWDALIIAAAQVAGCAYLLTEDLQHDQDFDGVRVVDFQRVTPAELLLR